MTGKTYLVPRAFIWRRVHSLTGLLIVLFLVEHLLTNSQAALFFGDDGNGFVRAVNAIHHLPYLSVIEIVLIGIPILFHGMLGIRYAFMGKHNAHRSDGTKPSMREFGRNRAYSWQRYTAWIVLIGIIGHVGFMRFYAYPLVAKENGHESYFIRLHMDPGLYTVAKRLHVELFDQSQIDEKKRELQEMDSKMMVLQSNMASVENKLMQEMSERQEISYDAENAAMLDSMQTWKQKKQWVAALTARGLYQGQVIGVASEFGDAILLNVRDAFKNVIVAVLYTIFVLATCFHAFNGLWTFCITWGVILQARAQSRMVNVCIGIMVVVALLGLASIWGTYWVNLKY
ncbi:MAG: succinate dehydrogenase [Chlamydiales bacterium]|nr:succinate dehydrogenase [Chlamydiales bacterium]